MLWATIHPSRSSDWADFASWSMKLKPLPPIWVIPMTPGSAVAAGVGDQAQRVGGGDGRVGGQRDRDAA